MYRRKYINPVQAKVFGYHIGWGDGYKVPPPPCFSLICDPISTRPGQVMLWNKISENVKMFDDIITMT